MLERGLLVGGEGRVWFFAIRSHIADKTKLKPPHCKVPASINATIKRLFHGVFRTIKLVGAVVSLQRCENSYSVREQSIIETIADLPHLTQVENDLNAQLVAQHFVGERR